MPSFRANLNVTLSFLTLSCTLMASPAFATRTHKSTKSSHAASSAHLPASAHLHSSRHHAAAPAARKVHGQQAIAPERVTPEAKLFEELDLDSIDAVDLAIKLQEMTGKRIKPDDFKNVRTVGDVIAAAQVLLAA